MFVINVEVLQLIKELISAISNFKDGQKSFKQLEKYAITHIQNSDSLFFINKREMDGIITSLRDKFLFHNYKTQANDLMKAYDQFANDSLAKQALANRLNVLKFLLSMSESPTNNQVSRSNEIKPEVEEEQIDWAQYLLDDVKRWSPPPDDDDSEYWSDDSNENFLQQNHTTEHANQSNRSLNGAKLIKTDDLLNDYHLSRTKLVGSVQNHWFNQERIIERPHSSEADANLAFLWDDFVYKSTGGLLPVKESSVISEYKILREIIWQFYEPHKSFAFHFVKDKLCPKPHVTVSSIRTNTCERFLNQFIPYIEWLHNLKEFHDSMNAQEDSIPPPDTFKCYDFAQQQIIAPIFDELRAIEDRIKEQDETFTLLKLAKEIRPLFKTIEILDKIHKHAILDFRTHAPFECAFTVLATLHHDLLFVVTKHEQDLLLTLFLGGLQKYFTIIAAWLENGELRDQNGEFIIERRVIDAKIDFVIREQPEQLETDSIMSLICTKVTQIGRNVHLLRLLGRLYLMADNAREETLHEQYTRRVLEEIARYFHTTEDLNTSTKAETIQAPSSVKTDSLLNQLHQFADTSDGFLLNAFENFATNNRAQVGATPITLYDRVKTTTKSLFPVQEVTAKVFLDVLTDRFSATGLLVKNLLIDDYHLEKQFALLRHIFLFQDDLIFPFYKRIFDKMALNGSWGNSIRLTSHIQDVLMDVYGDVFAECCVEVKENWKYCDDPLKACGMISMQYRITWPVNLIIEHAHIEMYKELFQLILKIKWALYRLNHLYFAELQLTAKQHRCLRKITNKLRILRFNLLNEFSRIQHFILGLVFSTHLQRFAANFRDVYDLESLHKAHDVFITSLYRKCVAFRDCNASAHGFYMLLYLVRKLGIMWGNFKEVDDADLGKFEKALNLCHSKMEPLILPEDHLFTNNC